MLVKNYELNTHKDIKGQTIAVASDIHISEHTKDAQLYEIEDTIRKIKPTQIVLPGDLYNVDDTTVYTGEGKIVTEFISTLTKIAHVYYTQGNAEQKSSLLPYGLYNNTNPLFHMLCSVYANYTGEERNYSSTDVINMGNINIAGICPPKEFYFQSELARVELFLTRYQEYLERISKQCSPEDFNILLCHDPLIVEACELLQNFDLVISGHNHGGLFPPVAKPLFKLMGANLELLYPTYTKGMITKGNTAFLTSEGVTRFHSDSGKFEPLERFHEGTIETVRVRTRKK